MRITRSILLMSAAALLSSGPLMAESASQKMDQAVQEGKTTFFDFIDKDGVSVGFEKGSSALTDTEKSNLRAAVDAARKDAKVDRVVIAAWSDSDLPKDNNVKLSDAEQKLADKRAEAIESYLKDIDVASIETYSMAEQANWFQRMFKTDEAQIKRAMKGLATDSEINRTLADKLTSKGGPSHAAVLIITDNSYLSH